LVFVRLFYFREDDAVCDSDLPKVVILMGLKDTDPYLQEGIVRLTRQDYPDYELQIVVHSRDDPAWEVVERAIQESGATNVRVDEFRKDLDVFGLHCSNSKTVQSLNDLDESFEIIAMAEGDLMAHRHWLRELVLPMVLDERVGATFGNRWYMPAVGQWGSLIRYLWNVGAVVQMYLLGIPWGGAMAIRASVVRQDRLADRWAGTIAIDQTIPPILKQRGLRTKFVPALMMVNREECDGGSCMNFLQRQMTWARVYHPHWRSVVAHSVLTSAVLIAPLILVLVGLALRRPDVVAWAGGGFVAYHIVILMTIGIVECGVRHAVHAQGEKTAWLSPRVLLRLPAALVLIQWVYLFALLKAIFARFVRWRGITLEILGRNKIRNPMASPPEAPTASVTSQVDGDST